MEAKGYSLGLFEVVFIQVSIRSRDIEGVVLHRETGALEMMVIGQRVPGLGRS